MLKYAGKVAVALVLGAVCCRASYAMGSVAEAGLTYEYAGVPSALTVNSYTVQGFYAFTGLDENDGPLNEALFLSRSPYAGLGLGAHAGDMSGFEFDGSRVRILGGYTSPDVPVSIDLSYTMDQLEGTGATVDWNFLEFSAGYFAMPSLLVSFDYESRTSESSAAPGKDETTGVGVSAKWVQAVANGQAFNAELSYKAITEKSTGIPDEEGSEFAIGGDYYITPTVGIGLEFTDETGETSNDGGQTIEVRASVFVAPQVGVRVSYASYSPNDSTQDDTDFFNLGVFGRF